jgi:hypothetical protein
MNNKVDPQVRVSFRDFLRGELQQREFYQKRGDHYLIREFAKYCTEQGAPIDEASLGRYLRDDEPVLPTPERCRALAKALELPPLRLLGECGYITPADCGPAIPSDISPSEMADMIEDAALLAWSLPAGDLLELKAKARRKSTNKSTKENGKARPA